MDYSVLEKSTLFRGIPASELRAALESTPHHIQCYDKDEAVFHMMDTALRTGIVLEGRVQAQKAFPNGSQINVSVRVPGELIRAGAGHCNDVSQGGPSGAHAKGCPHSGELHDGNCLRRLYAAAEVGAVVL